MVKPAFVIAVLLSATTAAKAADAPDMGRRYVDAAERTFFVTLMVARNPQSQHLCTQNRYACVGYRPYELALGILHASRDPHVPRVIADLSRFRFDAAVAEDYACVVQARRAEVAGALESINATKLSRRCVSEVEAFLKRQRPGEWSVKPESICRTPAEVRAEVDELRALTQSADDCE